MGILDGLMGNASEVSLEQVQTEFTPLLVPGETLEKAFKILRDVLVFTSKRLIVVDKQGLTGSKVEYLSIPYKSITRFSKESGGMLDLDAELNIWVTGQAEPIKKEFRKSGKRVLFLDYDGTLVGFNSDINAATPDKELYDIITRLSANPANLIVLISGRNSETLEKWFGHLPIDIIAEHGARQKRYKSEWLSVSGLSNSWKQDIFPLLETYTDRTPGSFIEEKTYSLVWHYRRVDKGLGELRANELINNLNFLTTDKALQVLPGNKIIEIKNMEINKGKAAQTRLENTDYDFILAMGDDHTDEDIFKALPQNALTIKIGSSVSAARYYLWDFREVRMLLHDLIKADEAVISEW